MKEELYKLLCCMLPYDVQIHTTYLYGNRKPEIHKMKNESLIWMFDKEHYLVKPLLKSWLSEEENIKLGSILYPVKRPAARSKDIAYREGVAFLYNESIVSNNKSFGIIKTKEAIEYLYSIHYAFNIDKSLYIEKS